MLAVARIFCIYRQTILCSTALLKYSDISLPVRFRRILQSVTAEQPLSMSAWFSNSLFRKWIICLLDSTESQIDMKDGNAYTGINKNSEGYYDYLLRKRLIDYGEN